ncbi:unnamed protein product [Schistosoma curassoni]|nr:unnamed protein product [Schistosoma curassoni]
MMDIEQVAFPNNDNTWVIQSAVYKNSRQFLYPLLYFCGISKSMLLCSGGIGLHLLPILVCVLTFVAVTTCDAGSKIPESCIFGQLLNIVSVLAGLCFYSWHKHLLDYSQKFNQQCYRQIRLARVALCFGLICAVGMSIVANFQQRNMCSLFL